MAHIHMNTITAEYHDMVPHLRRAMDEPDYPTVGIEPPCPSLLAQCEIDSLREELQCVRARLAYLAEQTTDEKTKAELNKMI
jgi:hypothetical protein